MKTPQEVEEYLARIRKTIADSQSVIDAANLRIQETDRLLESQGLTREQVLNFKVTPEHRLAVNEELRRRGLPPLEEDDASSSFDAATAELRGQADAPAPAPDDELAERQRRFGNLMHEFRI
ncbi:MAG: hypothetical protein Q4G65_14525 [bacterium]|nr:hypothetical protein [bacterium]